jgi:hypothetical protein
LCRRNYDWVGAATEQDFGSQIAQRRQWEGQAAVAHQFVTPGARTWSSEAERVQSSVAAIPGRHSESGGTLNAKRVT